MNSEDSRNLILAIVLSVARPDRLELFLRRAAIAEGPSGANADPGEPAPRPLRSRRRGVAPAERGARRGDASRRGPRRSPPASGSPIDTRSLGGSINLTGGLLDDLTLKAYRETIDPNSPNITLFSPQGGPTPIGRRAGYVAEAGTQGQAAGARHGLDQRFRTR